MSVIETRLCYNRTCTRMGVFEVSAYESLLESNEQFCFVKDPTRAKKLCSSCFGWLVAKGNMEVHELSIESRIKLDRDFSDSYKYYSKLR